MNIRQKNKHIIKKFKINPRTDILPYACTSKITRYDLPDLYKEFGYKVGAEIGVSKGGNAKNMFIKCPGLKLYCVDPYIAYKIGDKASRSQKQQDRIFEKAKQILKGFNAEFVRKTSMDAVKDFKDESLDFIYIDGDHKFDYVMTDLIFWSYKVKSGGMIALHDYCYFHWTGVIYAVNAYVYCHEIRPWFITKEQKSTAFWVKP